MSLFQKSFKLNIIFSFLFLRTIINVLLIDKFSGRNHILMSVEDRFHCVLLRCTILYCAVGLGVTFMIKYFLIRLNRSNLMLSTIYIISDLRVYVITIYILYLLYPFYYYRIYYERKEIYFTN